MKTCSVEGCDRPHSCKSYCTVHYKRYKRNGAPGESVVKSNGRAVTYCAVDGCDRIVKAQSLCSTHYMRYQAHGDPTVNLNPPNPDGYVRNNGYIVRTNRGHPVADSGGKVYIHREVLYDAIGEGPHQCHWGCGTELHWRVNLTVDHLDSNKQNNEITNLVPSCQTCNSIREGVYKRGRPKKQIQGGQ